MLFSSPVFLLHFLPLVVGLHLVLPWRLKNPFLLLASLFFYAWGEPVVVLVMLLAIVSNWGFGLLVARAEGDGRRRLVVAAAVVFDLALLVYFKYTNLLLDSWNALAATLGGPTFELARIALPIGISFFLFQALSYVLDVYRGDTLVQRNPLRFGLYIALFPQLIAGPIVRYRDVAAAIARRTVDRAGFAAGVRRFVLGLGKKVLLANVVATSSDAIFDGVPPGHWNAGMAWVALAGYTLQIYFDFSGYSDMAIGLGRMLGFRFLENFDYPYASRSITEFWRRWHISLSTWFRDYLYIPLGGSRRGPLVTYRNLVLVFLLCGLWHGASWNFVVWGAFHGAFLVLERVGLGRVLERTPRPLRHVYVIAVVMLGWVFFRVESLRDAGLFLRALLGLGTGDGVLHHTSLYADAPVWIALAAGAVGSLPLLPRLTSWRLRIAAAAPAPVAWTLELLSVGLILCVLVACGMMMAAGTHDPFIYFRF